MSKEAVSIDKYGASNYDRTTDRPPPDKPRHRKVTLIYVEACGSKLHMEDKFPFLSVGKKVLQ